ncbi:methionyl-tRNA formyltransferase [candidate division WWE3 bacterium]|nr:methionyl-tRNA formyltransferase [candidate division WWE3 bacterium]
MRVLFWGSDYYSTIPLQILINHKIEIVGVITGKNKSSMPFSYDSVSEIAQKNHIPIIYAEKKKELLEQLETIENLNPDIGLVASYGVIIPKELFELPHFKTLNLHPSKLPKYRGPSPVPQSILDDEKETAITIMEITEKMDSGDILSQLIEPIKETDTTASLLKRLFQIGAHEFIRLLPHIDRNDIPKYSQDDSNATYTSFFTQEPCRINWQKSPHEISLLIRAFYPKPVAWTTLGELISRYSNKTPSPKQLSQRVKIHSAHPAGNDIIPETLQLEGKTPVSWEQFSRGYLQ